MTQAATVAEPAVPSTVGLALGGGGALGAAHIGVLWALHEKGIDPNIVTGTSAGALVGAAYAAGVPLPRIDHAVRHATWSTFGTLRPTPRLGLLDSSALLDTIESMGGDRLIEALPRRFAAVATDVRSRQAVLIDRGLLSTALRASMAVPGIFSPMKYQGHILVDGALSMDVPLAACRTLGATAIIGVRLHAQREYSVSRYFSHRTRADDNAKAALLIAPKLDQFAQWSREDVPRIIESGYLAASQALTQVGSLDNPTAHWTSPQEPLLNNPTATLLPLTSRPVVTFE